MKQAYKMTDSRKLLSHIGLLFKHYLTSCAQLILLYICVCEGPWSCKLITFMNYQQLDVIPPFCPWMKVASLSLQQSDL